MTAWLKNFSLSFALFKSSHMSLLILIQIHGLFFYYMQINMYFYCNLLLVYLILFHYYSSDNFLFFNKRQKRYRCRWKGKNGVIGRTWGRGNCNQNLLYEKKSICNKKRTTYNLSVYIILLVCKFPRLTFWYWIIKWWSTSLFNFLDLFFILCMHICRYLCKC